MVAELPEPRLGTTSRVHRAPGERHPWTTVDGHVVDLPVVVDIMHVDPDTHEVAWQIDVTVDLVNAFPAIVNVNVQSAGGLNHAGMQANFRWATPLDVVTQTIPELLALGLDPFTYHYPLKGFPEAARVTRAVPTRLTDAFLEAIVARYLILGRGYAQAIAAERHVSVRTVVSWIEKARQRGILSGTTPGAHGGELVKPAPTTA